MRKGAVLLVVALVGGSASVALASPPAGKGKPSQPGAVTAGAGRPEGKGKPRTGDGCRPQVTVILKGLLVTPPGEAGTSLTLTVTRTNAHGRSFAADAKPVSVGIVSTTVFRRQGAKAASALLVGDRVLVQARACKADLASTGLASLTAAQLTAARVIAHPANATSGGGTTAPTPTAG